MGFPGDSVVKEGPINAGDAGSIPGLGRSPGEGNSNLLQYSWLENSMHRGDWQAIVDGNAKSQTQLSNWACTHTSTYQILNQLGLGLVESERNPQIANML